MLATLLDFYLPIFHVSPCLSVQVFIQNQLPKMSWHFRSKPVYVCAAASFSSGASFSSPSFPRAASQLLVSWCPAAFLPTAGFLPRAPFSSDLASSAAAALSRQTLPLLACRRMAFWRMVLACGFSFKVSLRFSSAFFLRTPQ